MDSKPMGRIVHPDSWVAVGIVALGLIALESPHVHADILRVPADHPTIQEALDVAADGDTVLVAPGEYLISSPLDFNRWHDPFDDSSPPLKDLELRSEAGAEATIIRMSETPIDSGDASVFVFESGESTRSVVAGFTVTGGQGTRLANTLCFYCAGLEYRGGGFLVVQRSSVHIRDCVIAGNFSETRTGSLYTGGGLFVEDSTVELSGTEIRENFGDVGAAIIAHNGDVSLSGVRILSNHNRSRLGPLIELAGTASTMTDVLVAGNFSRSEGIRIGGIAPVTMDRITISGNDFAGSPLVVQSRGELKNSILWNNGFLQSVEFPPEFDVHHSCIAGVIHETVIESDPEFCAWGPQSTRHVSAGAPAGGDGSEDRPFGSLRDALRFGYGLAATSPCRTAGEDGGAIGARLASCEEAGRDAVRVALGTGEHELAVIPLTEHVSLIGEGTSETTVRGTIVGVRSDAEVQDLTVTDGPAGGIWMSRSSPDAGPAILEALDIRGCRGNGGLVAEFARVEMTSCRIVRNSANSETGSGAFVFSTELEISDCLIAENRSHSGVAAFFVGGDSVVTIDRVTIAGNWSPAGASLHIARGIVELGSSIVWETSESGAIRIGNGGVFFPEFSCIPETFTDFGSNNIAVDPLFCGWARDLAYVDAREANGGDGTESRPFRALTDGLEYSWALAEDSPCRGTGKDGVDRGWSAEPCVGDRVRATTVRLARGRYVLDTPLNDSIVIEGEGAENTIVAGDVRRLREGSALRGLTIEGSVYVAAGDSALIESCTLRGDDESGLVCERESAPRVVDTTITGSATTAVVCGDRSQPIFERVVISDNGGVALSANGAEVELLEPKILRNAGGLHLSGGVARISGGLVARNFGQLIVASRTVLTLVGTTIAHNTNPTSASVLLEGSTTIRDSIVWANSGLTLTAGRGLVVSHSCIEGELFPGEGNLNVDPMFCGFDGAEDTWVDPSAPAEGNGSRERPHRSLLDALDFRYSLAENSPCRASASDGGDIGASLGICPAPGLAKRAVNLAQGIYPQSIGLGPGVTLAGAGRTRTIIRGAVVDVHARVADLRVEPIVGDGVIVPAGATAVLERLAIEGAERSAVVCGSDSNVSITGTWIDGSGASGVECWSGTQLRAHGLTVSHTRGVPGRHGALFGGGLLFAEDVKAELTRSRVVRNRVTGIVASSENDVVLTACDISANGRAGIQGFGARLSVVDSLLTGNENFSGTAITGHQLVLELVGCTVTENQFGGFRAGAGDVHAAIAAHESEIRVRNSIVWGNGNGQSIENNRSDEDPIGFTKLTNSIVDGEIPEHAELTGIVGTDPLFRLRGDGQGPSWTRGDYRLRRDSPAIDAGAEPIPTAMDLAGRPRVCGPASDLGAYEYCTSAFRRGDANTDGAGNIADAIFVLGFLFEGGITLECAAAADLNADDGVNVADPIYLLNYLFGDGSPPPPPFEACGEADPDETLDCEAFPGCE